MNEKQRSKLIKEFYSVIFSKKSSREQIINQFQKKDKWIPDSLFRFYSFDEKGYWIHPIKNAKIWLAHADTFNDLHDSSFYVDWLTYDLFTNVSRQQELKNCFKKQNVKSGEIQHIFNTFLKQLKNSKKSNQCYLDFLEKYIVRHSPGTDIAIERKKFFDEIDRQNKQEQDDNLKAYKDNSRFHCFSSINTSLSMWYHYAKNYTGFCLEYEKSNIISEDKRRIYPMQYCNDLPDLTDLFIDFKLNKDKDTTNYLNTSVGFTTKSTNWEYEQEWRFVFHGWPQDQDQLYPFTRPSKIYLGSEIAPANEELIREIAAPHQIPIVKMRLHPKEYKMIPLEEP